MSWYTYGVNGPPGYERDYITSDDIDTNFANAIQKDLRSWGGPVDAAQQNLSNLGVLTFGASGYLSGNIGFGTASPDTRVDLGAPLNLRSVSLYADGGTGWATETNNNLTGSLSGITCLSNVAYGPAGNFAWRSKAYADRNTLATPGTLLMMLTNSGNLGLGRVPETLLTLQAPINNGLSLCNAAGTLRGIFFNTTDNQISIGTTTSHPVAIYTANAPRVTIAANGSFSVSGSAAKPGGGTWADTSDERTKRNITDFTAGLDVIRNLRPVQYENNGLGGTIEGFCGVSLIAQEAREHLPGCVRPRLGKLHPDDTEDTEILTFDLTTVLYAMLNAIKELAAALEAKQLERTIT